MDRVQAAALIRKYVTQYSKKRDAGMTDKRFGEIWIRCPFHNNGRERTPSMAINVDVRSKRFFSFHCFGCREHGKWPKLAAKIHCDPIVDAGSDEVYNEEALPLFDQRDRDRLLGVDADFAEIVGFTWPETSPWRNISGQVVHDAGWMLFIDTVYPKDRSLPPFQKDRVFFPVRNDGVIVGGVRANIEPEPGGNYFNTKNLASSRCLLFTELADNMMDAMNGDRVCVLCEGPRDSLNIVQHGYASVCNLGAVNSWHITKVNLLFRLNVDLLILMLDGDSPGRACADQIYRDIDGAIPVHDVVFPVNKDGSKKYDASDLSSERVTSIVRAACAAFNLSPPRPYDWTKQDTSGWQGLLSGR